MKEYLTKMQDGSYKLIPSKMSEDDIEVPDGAEIFTEHERGECFYKKGECSLEFFDNNQWEVGGYDLVKYENEMSRLGRTIVWQRESLNDKVASAEVARQELKGVDATLAERQSQYGSFAGVANTTGQLMAVIINSPNGHTMPYAHEEALHMICSKIARIMNGDINHLDSWHDIGGYAKLIEDLIREAS